MNIKAVINILGKVMLIEAGLLLCPLLVGAIYGENSYVDYLVPMAVAVGAGLPSCFVGRRDRSIYAREGFVTVALAWILMSLVGALPFMLSGALPSYADALFETVSGFTTTGATVFDKVEGLPHSLLLWRSFTHLVGGMGVLVFVLAVLPDSSSGAMHIFRAEAPGPSVGKLVSKLRLTARILYAIYLAMTLVEALMLLAGGMPAFDSFVHSFSTAGTGGFGIKNDSIAGYSVYSQMVIAVFMFLFGLNFNLYYLILIGSVGKAMRSEEMHGYLVIVVLATLSIALNIMSMCGNFAEALRLSFFQVASISSTTGFSTADFGQWPAFSKGVLVVLMIVGACGGSTGGGIKVSRLMIMCKAVIADIRRMLHPRSVVSSKLEGELLDERTERNVFTYFALWVAIVALCTLLLGLDKGDLLTNFTATLACIGNIGPGLGLVGPMANFGWFSAPSKLLLSFVMLVGRLEIFPIIILFAPRTWKRG